MVGGFLFFFLFFLFLELTPSFSAEAALSAPAVGRIQSLQDRESSDASRAV